MIVHTDLCFTHINLPVAGEALTLAVEWSAECRQASCIEIPDGSKHSRRSLNVHLHVAQFFDLLSFPAGDAPPC